MKITDAFDISGKTALITGSTGGLGSVFARGLAENGVRVILNGRNRPRLEEQKSELIDIGPEPLISCFDVRNSTEITREIDRLMDLSDGIDILINNAGVNIRGPLEDFPEEDWDKVLEINLTGAFKVSRAVAKHMIGKKSGKIINLGSMQSELSRPGIAPYAASKGGIKMLTKAMAADWAKYNIQVNAIGPGYFKTEMTRALYENPEFDQWLCNRTPASRWGDPEELLGALFLLCSPASGYINGQMIYVDGGMLSVI